jgi:hypothetical protein
MTTTKPRRAGNSVSPGRALWEGSATRHVPSMGAGGQAHLGIDLVLRHEETS